MKTLFLSISVLLSGALFAYASDKPSVGAAAVVNGVVIREEDVNRGMLAVEKDLKKEGRQPSAAIVPELRRLVLDKLIEQELLVQESRKAGIHVDDNLVQEHLMRIREGIPDEKAYRKAMKEADLSDTTLREQIRRGLAVQKLLERHLRAKLDVTDAEIRRFYDEHLEDFREPQRFGFHHILMLAGPGMDSARRSLVRRNMEDALERLKRGEDFGAVAGEVSQCRSAGEGGDLGYVDQGELPRELNEALAVMQPGETSPVVETGMGYHIVKLYGVRSARTIPFEEAKEAAKTRLVEEIGRKEKEDYVRRLRDGSEIRIHP
jgi:parvulin-like peptidyl-prolyl isomerase